MSLNNFAQVRSQLVKLCNQDRFAAAHMFLVGSGHPPAKFPGLWEYLSRRSSLSKDGVIAHEARQALWQAGLRGADIALREATYFLNEGDWQSAAFVIREVFGPHPQDRRAHFMLAECAMNQARAEAGLARTRTSPTVALEMDNAHEPQTPAEAAALIDLLRFSGALERAKSRNTAARAAFPSDPRFDLRAASILEQLRDLAGAMDAWAAVSDRHPEHRTEALLKMYQLGRQLGRDDEMADIAAQLALSDLPLNDRMKLALATRQRDMIGAIARLAALSGDNRTALSHEAATDLNDMLLENGDIGLVVWLRRQRLPVSDAAKAILADAGFGETGHLPLPDTYREAARMRSPDFMLPLSAHLRRPPKPGGWPGRKTQFERLLLVNGTLGGGGAERQFIALVKALLQAGIPAEKIHCAFFSLEADRGFDRFLPDLEALDVAIYDLRKRRIANPTLPRAEAAVVDALPLELQEDVRGLWHLVRDLEPDTLHAWQDRAGLAAAIVGELAETDRIIISTRNMAPDTRGELRLVEMRALYKDILARSNCTLTANARLGARDYARWLDVEADRLPLLRNAIDPEVFHPAVVRERPPWQEGHPFVLGGVFRLAANKRPDLWLETVGLLRQAHGMEFHPTIFGAGPLQDAVAQRAAELGLDDLVLTPDTTDPGQIYARMDAMLLMSRVEGLPNVLLEAQACGIPVAASDVGGTSEALLQKGEGAGLLLPADVTARAAAAQLAQWLPVALRERGNRRQAFVRRTHAPEAIAREAISLYLGKRA